MSQVAIRKVNGGEKKAFPVFEEIEKRLEAVERRAFDLFEKRNREFGHELEDWLKAEHELLGWPAAELAEKDGAYELEITLPGFETKDVEVTAAANEVIVHAAAEKERKGQEGKVIWSEFGSNDVYRRFQVPVAINVERVTAKLDNGILHISAPKVEKPKETKVASA